MNLCMPAVLWDQHAAEPWVMFASLATTEVARGSEQVLASGIFLYTRGQMWPPMKSKGEKLDFVVKRQL